MSVADIQVMTMAQVMVELGVNNTQDDADTKVLEASIEWLLRVAAAFDLTAAAFAALGPVRVAELCVQHTGQPVTAEKIWPLLLEPEFET